MHRNVEFFCYVTIEYLPQALVLADSINKLSNNSNLIIVPLDYEGYNILKKNYKKNIKLSRDEIQKIINKFEYYKVIRTKPEAVFTLKPYIFLQVLSKIKSNSLLFYLDADSIIYSLKTFHKLYFENKSIMFSPHYENKILSKNIKKVGKYNAGVVGIRNNLEGFRALTMWNDLCEFKCSLRYEKESYADQKYLENVAADFQKELEEIPPTINVANWRIEANSIVKNGFLDYYEIEHYHFHALSFNFRPRLVFTQISRYVEVKNIRSFKHEIYEPYLRLLFAKYSQLGSNFQSISLFKKRFSLRFFFTSVFSRDIIIMWKGN